LHRQLLAFAPTTISLTPSLFVAISRKRVMIEEKLLRRAYRKSPTLFRTVPSPTPYGLLFPKIGVCNPHPKHQSILSQERVKLRTSNLASIFRGSIRTKAHPGTAQIFWVPRIISGTGKSTNFKFCTSIGSIGTKAH